jgi:cupin fold WbuC family metalloprotein
MDQNLTLELRYKMIEKYYSKIDKNKILHLVHRLREQEDVGREDIVEQDNFIQCSFLKMPNGKTFQPHKHIVKEKSFNNYIAQESWVVIRGKVKCIFYDIDDSILTTTVLEQGDASFTLFGGHNYEILEDNTIVYEYKTGPYEGQKLDKKFININ